MDKSSLGDRMKSYERATQQVLPIRLPVMLRVDGRSFSQYTKSCDKPFDEKLIHAMWRVAQALCEDIQGAQLAYVQSDEISVLIHNYKTLNSDSWFGNKVQKMCSIAAGISSGVMTLESANVFGEYRRACFDARAWVLPEAEVCNGFVWRQQDATRNSVQMLARSLYSHKQLHKKNNSELQELCFQRGKNWNDLPVYLRRGACIVKETYNAPVPLAYTGNQSTAIRTRWVVDKKIPIFSQDRDYIDQHLKVEE